jgi:hypothetical protein
MLFGFGEEHVGGLEALTLAVVEVEDEVVLEDVVVGGKAKFTGGLVDGVAGAFKFDESANGGFVEVDEEIFGPLEAGGKTEGGAVLFIAEPAAQAEAFKDFLEGGGLGDDHFNFFADLVAAVGRRSGGTDGELFGRAFEGEENAGGGFFGGELLPCRGEGFSADAEELAVLGETTFGSVEDEVVLVDARGDGVSAEFLQKTEEGFGVGDSKFDFGFARHRLIVREEAEEQPVTSDQEGKSAMNAGLRGKTRQLRSFSYPHRIASG